ncbi:BAQ_1a_G0017680.mRNA.1.CDS.1 [Saccharomyces cerevisiae]|nr:BAQ_1a_G0017680.mRNA.1.CDS.1 [Saccharomyces cerevisiae]CAI7111225.1 BAQ_1a_G0017680.mRNA.1.CDS.1 [Saccharomyces cerevisiae]
MDNRFHKHIFHQVSTLNVNNVRMVERTTNDSSSKVTIEIIYVETPKYNNALLTESVNGDAASS